MPRCGYLAVLIIDSLSSVTHDTKFRACAPDPCVEFKLPSRAARAPAPAVRSDRARHRRTPVGRRGARGNGLAPGAREGGRCGGTGARLVGDWLGPGRHAGWRADRKT